MIIYLKGDATNPKEGNYMKIICHINNNVGKWGKGFVLGVSKKWPIAKKQYISLDNYELGDVQLINVSDDIIIANMIAQDGINKKGSAPIKRVDYDALDKCLSIVAQYAKNFNCSIHMPRIGTGLGGGEWTDIEDIIIRRMLSLDIYVYDL